jgi:Protein of unknown function (DUF3435)
VSANFDIEVATEYLLQQVMNHRDAGIFQAYVNERVGCDVQAVSADALTKGVGRMGRYVEPCAPTEVTQPEVDALKPHPYVVKLRQLRDSLPKALRDKYGTIAKAIGTEMYDV